MERTHRRSGGSSRSQHFLAGTRLAKELVAQAGLNAGDVVLDVGAGHGVLTVEIARHVERVIAIERDASVVEVLRRRTASLPNVEVVRGDALQVRLPTQPFKVVSNPPFHITTPLLRRLLDPVGNLQRADLVLSWGQAIGLTQVYPTSPAALRWLPWFELILVRRLAADSFRPAPAMDAGVVSVRRRPRPLLPPSESRRYWASLSRTAMFRGIERARSRDVWQATASYQARYRTRSNR